MRPVLPLALAALVTTACASASAQQGGITDDAIAKFGAQPWSKREWMMKTQVLGERAGVKVIAEHPCSDLCPAYTICIVHFDVAPGPDCEKLGGVKQTLTVPVSIAVMRKDFCVPAVLVDRGLSPNTKGT